MGEESLRPLEEHLLRPGMTKRGGVRTPPGRRAPVRPCLRLRDQVIPIPRIDLPDAEGFARIERDADLGEAPRRLDAMPARRFAHKVLGPDAETREDAAFVVGLPQSSRRLVVRRRKELPDRDIVNVVFAPVEDLLETVRIATRLRGREPGHFDEQVGHKVVERPALEAAIAIEHQHRLVLHVGRLVAAGAEHRRMVHEIVHRRQHEPEHPVGLRTARKTLQPQCVGEVAEAARIDISRIEDDRIRQRTIRLVGDLDKVRRDRFRAVEVK